MTYSPSSIVEFAKFGMLICATGVILFGLWAFVQAKPRGGK